MSRNMIITEVKAECERQEELWGGINDRCHDNWLSILVEEVGEVARAMNDLDEENLRDEIIQVAAVAVSMCEALDVKWDKEHGYDPVGDR